MPVPAWRAGSLAQCGDADVVPPQAGAVRPQAEGHLEFVQRNMPRLEALIAECMEWQTEIAELEYRARTVRDRHEPPAPQTT